MSNQKMVELLRIWKYSLGSFSDSKTEPYDNWIAGIRTVIFVSYMVTNAFIVAGVCLLYTSPSPRDRTRSRMPSSA